MQKFLTTLSLLLMTALSLFCSFSEAATAASCTVSVFRDGHWVVLIKTPNLQSYSSFSFQTCTFPSADGRVRLGTSVLSHGMVAVSLTEIHNNKVVVKSTTTGPTKVLYQFTNSGYLSSGEEIEYKCSIFIDPADVVDSVTCS